MSRYLWNCCRSFSSDGLGGNAVPYLQVCSVLGIILTRYGLQIARQTEALFLKLNSLQDKATGTLAGKMGTVVDLVTRLPIQIWFEQNPKASDTRFEDRLLALVTAKT